jgi:hypothetical protein
MLRIVRELDASNTVLEQQEPISYRIPAANESLLLTKSQSHDVLTWHSTPGASATSGILAAADVIGYVVTITDCMQRDENGTNVPFPITEGAAILSHSIQQQHPNNHRYGAALYAIVHPEAALCAQSLVPFGYTILERTFPVSVSEIRGQFLRESIATSGCCGERELIKLLAYTLIQHNIIVLLDLDVILLQPLDRLFDLLLTGQPLPQHHLQWPTTESAAARTGLTNIGIPSNYNDISLIYTIDYAMVSPGRKVKPFQGGFLVLRPNVTVFHEFVSIVRDGNFQDRAGGGWGGQTGRFWGAMTIQGLLPYYYLVLHPGRAVELNRCIYDNMASNPMKTFSNGKKRCYTQEHDCEDCRNRSIDTIVSAHFTICQKPWLCLRYHRDTLDHRLCRHLHAAWFHVRSDLEQSWGRLGHYISASSSSSHNATYYDFDHFHGYCVRSGKNGYIAIQQPYGQKVVSAT